MSSVTPSLPDNVPILKGEVTALEELSRFLFLEAHEVQNALERIEWSKSCQVRNNDLSVNYKQSTPGDVLQLPGVFLLSLLCLEDFHLHCKHCL